jgi:nucleotide-binding universal stress UspA family protein
MITEKRNGNLKILVGDDCSEDDLEAVALLEDLPISSETEIIVFRAFSATRAREITLMEDALYQTCNQLRKKGLKAKAELQEGFPMEKFLKYAEEQKPDLIIIGAKGLQATAGILLGVVVQHIFEYAPCPVLVIRGPYNGLRRVMLITDGSASSQQALQYLDRMPLPVDTRIWVMHVLPPRSIPQILLVSAFLGGMPVAIQDTEEYTVMGVKEMEAGQALIKETLEALQLMGKKAEGILKRGDAATEIMAVVKELNIDLLITGSRRLSPIRSVMMGSVTRTLVHYSNCSVLVASTLQPG